MTEADVARIESELGVDLPAHYRAFVLAYPQSLREARCGYPEGPASASFLFDDPAAVIEANRRFRRPDALPIGHGWDPWPDDYLIIGMDQPWQDVGDAYCVRLTGRGRSVWAFHYEEGGNFVRFSPSLADFERAVLGLVGLINGGSPDHAEPGAAPDPDRDVGPGSS
jgi:hypothetical protein